MSDSLVEQDFTKANISIRYTKEFIIYPKKRIRERIAVIRPSIREGRNQKFRRGLHTMAKYDSKWVSFKFYNI